MAQPLTDRRADTRFGQPVIAGTQAILRPGYAVSLVDLDCQIKYLDGPIREVEIELFGHEVSG